MYARIDAVPTEVLSKERAEESARALQEGELDGWTYHPTPVQGGYVVEVRDEDGNLVGKF